MGLGRMIISEEVFVELAKTAMNKVENVVTDSQSKDTLGQIVKSVAQRLSPHIHVKKNDREKDKPEADIEAGFVATVAFELKLTVVYGVSIPEVVNVVRQKVKEEVETISGYKVDRIDVIVEKLVKPEKLMLATEEEK